MGGTIVLMLIEALLILLALLISKAIRFISPSLYANQPVAVDDRLQRLKLEVAITTVPLIMRKEASLILLGISFYKAIRFICPWLNGNQPDAVDDSYQDDVVVPQTIYPQSSHIVVAPPATKYDVFLSFRGEDTRHSFVSHLYNGLCKACIDTFMDHKLRKGDQISQVLMSKIEESEISMIIFSENYASSKWCMDELVQILECKKKFGRVVIPIFYNVDPSNIRKQNGRFGKGFNVLKQRFQDKPEELQKLRDALVEATNLSGWDSNSTRPEAKLVEGIVEEALSKLKYSSSYHLEGLVGIQCHIKNIKNLLSKADTVGIWGMGGAGKTTLAKAIFQELRAEFNGVCFIEKVTQKLQKMSLDELLKIILKEVLECKEINIYDIKSAFVKKRLGRKKILLILDDMDNSRIAEELTKVFECFGDGSRIIITSRDMQVLKNASAFETYVVPQLDPHQALHLFSLKAFKKNEPSEGYMELSELVVEYCEGNALALVVLGCSLSGKNKEVWESALQKLEKDPPKDVVDVLKLSFDGLDKNQQEVFLDLAFSINEGVCTSLDLIKQLYGTYEVDVLRDKSLILYEYNYIEMHDLVKKMGLEIARKQLSSDVGTPIRLWRNEDIVGFFNRGKGINAVRCLSFDVSRIKSIKLTANIFQMMDNLIYLKIYKSDGTKPLVLNIRGVLNHISKELRFFSWEECPLRKVPLHLCAENLIRFEMPNSKIQQLWNGKQHFPNLKEIDLSNSKDLTALPDLSDAPKIKELILNGCVKLAQIHSSTFPSNGFRLLKMYCGPVQIKVGGSMKGRSSRLLMVYNCLDLVKLSFHKVTVEVLVCGNRTCGVRYKHVEMQLEEREELRKGAQSLGSLIPFVRKVKWLEIPNEFWRDGYLHFHFDLSWMMKEHQVVTKTPVLFLEDEEEDEVFIEDCCSESVTFTRVPNSITRWSLLTKLTLKSLALISHDEDCSIPPVSILKSFPLSREYCTVPIDATLSFPNDIPLPDRFPDLTIQYSLERRGGFCYGPPFYFNGQLGYPNDSINDFLKDWCLHVWGPDEVETWLKL